MLSKVLMRKDSHEGGYPGDTVPNDDDKISVTQSLEDPELETYDENRSYGVERTRLTTMRLKDRIDRSQLSVPNDTDNTQRDILEEQVISVIVSDQSRS